MNKFYYFVVLIMLSFFCCNNVMAEEITMSNVSQIEALQKHRMAAKLYAPNFCIIGKEAEFKVFATPNTPVKLILNFGYSLPEQKIEQTTNEQGVAIFQYTLPEDKELVGGSFSVNAYVYDAETQTDKKAVLQNASATNESYNRVYIADNDTAKGVLFTPWKALNQLIMDTSYDERSGYDPYSDRLYDDTTPVYVKNMRDAQENVKEVPRNFNHSN